MGKTRKTKTLAQLSSMTVGDFMNHIAIIRREQETGKKFIVVGASPAKLIGKTKVL